MRVLILAAAIALTGCDLDVVVPQPAALTPTAPGAISITTNNTNTNTTGDRSDTQPPGTTPPGNGGGGTVIPLPAYGEQVARATAASNPGLVANSCQDTMGEAAWQFLDLLVRTLRAQDQRWGYLCKDEACRTFGRDVITYRATAAETGIWIVDVIGNHCPGPTDPPAEVRWGVLPFETVRRWAATRIAGVF